LFGSLTAPSTKELRGITITVAKIFSFCFPWLDFFAINFSFFQLDAKLQFGNASVKELHQMIQLIIETGAST